VFVDSHVEKDGWAFLFGIAADCDYMRKVHFAQILRNTFRSLSADVYPAFLHYGDHLREKKPFGFDACTVNFEMFAGVRP
jgi:hypothetical protein